MESDFDIRGNELYRCLIQNGAVTVPKGVTLIRWNAFSNCTGLTSIHLPNTVQQIIGPVFQACPILQEITVEERDSRFSSCFSSVDGLLMNGSKLVACPLAKTEVTVPEGVTEIAPGVFALHTALTRVSLPETLTVIGENTFNGCANLTSLFIPKSVGTIGADAFLGCKNLTEILVDTENRRYRSVDGILMDKQKVLCCPNSKSGDVVIPPGTKRVISCAFQGCTQLTGITLPDSITFIGADAFSGCTNLRRLKFPANLEKINVRVCKKCERLEEVVLPESVTAICKYAFCHTGLRRVELPATLQSVATSAFRNCTQLEELVIRSDIVSIALEAFANCGLRRITISGTPKLIPSAFTDCGPLDTVTAHKLSPASLPKGPIKDIALVTFARRFLAGEALPEQDEYLKYIKNQRKSLYSLAVKYEELLQLMFQEKFFTSKDIQPLLNAAKDDIPARAAILEYQDRNGGPPDPFETMDEEMAKAERIAAYVEKNGNLPVSELKKIWSYKKRKDGTLIITSYKGAETMVKVPDRIGKTPVTAIGEYAFSPGAERAAGGVRKARVKIKSVELPETITVLERAAFMDCISLETIQLPNSLEEIGVGVFAGCKTMVSIQLPKGLRKIGSRAFAKCPKLILYGYAGSCAKRYAIENRFIFKQID